jgi:hypothetical protein
VSLAVSWLRQGGLELTHLSHITAFLTLEMIPASVHQGISPLARPLTQARADRRLRSGCPARHRKRRSRSAVGKADYEKGAGTGSTNENKQLMA